MSEAKRLQDCLTLEDFEQVALDVWSSGARAMIQEGAGANRAVRANREAFERWALRPRILTDVSRIDTTTSVLGSEISLPILFAPSGMHSMSHPDAELVTAVAAAAEDTVMILSAATTKPMAEVRQAAGAGTTWFQMYWGSDRGQTVELIRMAEAQGCTALVITVDLPVRPIMGAEMRAGVAAIGHLAPMYVAPRKQHLNDGAWDHDARLTWADIEWFRKQTTLPIVLKGIMTREDAALAVQHGVNAVIVSNHGGRAIDTSRGTLDALPEVVEAVDGQIEVYVDGGIRRGHDVVVALALGARAVLIGRPVTWGIASGGSDGLRALVNVLRSELTSIMGLIGAPTVRSVTRDRVTAATL